MSYTMMAKSITVLELYYPMIQFLINSLYQGFRLSTTQAIES